MVSLNKLSDAEKAVIRDKQTEPPFSGEYENFFQDGIFVCRQCGLPLFNAKAKFDAQCGWPSFDATFPYAVKELLDADGERTEILCARCGGHLGHVFRGEQFTEKDTRHCANSLSIRFIPREDADEYMSKPENQLKPKSIVLGGGCFWCVEGAMLRVPGILASTSGYAGGTTKNPTYEQVSTGETGHIEVARILYDSQTLSLPEVLEKFFMIHDPTSVDRQGSDVGSQYRSAIFYEYPEDDQVIRNFIREEQDNYGAKIVTEVEPLDEFYLAEEYHQRYFEKNPYAAYCQVVIQPKIKKVEEEIKREEDDQ